MDNMKKTKKFLIGILEFLIIGIIWFVVKKVF